MINKVSNNYSAMLPTQSADTSESAQSAEKDTQTGPYLTVEDPASGYKYTYVVIGKNFKVLISCQPMEKEEPDDNKTAAKQEQAVDKAQDPYIISTQSFLLQQKQQKPYLRENLLEKIRIWEQCALRDKASASFDAEG